MPRRRSIRLWQTELFVVVIFVAILILSVSLSRGLEQTLTNLEEGDARRNASSLAAQVGDLLAPGRLAELREHVRQYRAIYDDDVWVYDADGSLIYTERDGVLPESAREQARLRASIGSRAYSQMDLRQDGYVVAGAAVFEPKGRRVGVVVIADDVDDSLSVLDAVRGRLLTTFWIALVVAGLLGFGFSEFIARRVRQMTRAAAAIADGDFGQRLPTSLVPREIFELAESYNRMAVTLGRAFSDVREREHEIAAVVASMGEGVIAFDSGGLVRVINPEAVRLLGLGGGRDDVVGRHVTAMTGDDTIRGLVGRGLAGSNVSGDVVLGQRSVLLHGTPIVDAEGATTGAVLLMTDITERRRLEEAQRRFVANASHEMRTPITALKGLLELLSGGAKDDLEVRDDFLRTMSLEVDRLGRLVADLLTLAQLEAGTLTLRREPMPVAALLGDVAMVMGPLAERAGMSLVVDAPDPALEVYCDRDRIMQVLVGFADNALKHAGHAGPVTVGAARDGDRVTFWVRDEGDGIDPDVIPRLFDRFFQADESRATPGGAGLGLSIAEEIIQAHGSAVEVVSRPGAGTTFRFSLPAVGAGTGTDATGSATA